VRVVKLKTNGVSGIRKKSLILLLLFKKLYVGSWISGSTRSTSDLFISHLLYCSEHEMRADVDTGRGRGTDFVVYLRFVQRTFRSKHLGHFE